MSGADLNLFLVRFIKTHNHRILADGTNLDQKSMYFNSLF